MTIGSTPMSGAGYNRIRAAQLELEKVMEEELVKSGWSKGWRKKNNLTFWIKPFPKEGIVTALSLEDALKWEYEL
jgi:hypothetical protein